MESLFDINRMGRYVSRTLDTLNFMPSIIRPTRITNDSDTLLDTIFIYEIALSFSVAHFNCFL